MNHHGPHERTALLPAPRVAPGLDLSAKAAGRPPALSANPDASGLLKALRRRLGLALSIGLLSAGIAGCAAYLLMPRAKYTAVATLHVSTNPKRIIFDPQERATDYRTYQKTQTALLKNRKVISHALAKPEVAGLLTIREQGDAEEWLEQNLKVEFPGGSEVLQVTLSGDRAEDLSKIVNAVVKSYMSVVVEEEYRERVARLDALRRLREKYETDLKLKRKSLRETASTVGMSDQKALALSQQYKAEHLGLAQRELMRGRRRNCSRPSRSWRSCFRYRAAPAVPRPLLVLGRRRATGSRLVDQELVEQAGPMVIEGPRARVSELGELARRNRRSPSGYATPNNDPSLVTDQEG